MKYIKENYIVIVSIVVILLLIGSVFLWNFIVDKQNEKKEEKDTTIDVMEVNNVNDVDSKLNGEDYKITQLYLLSYSTHKSGTWYMSSAYVSKIVNNGKDAIITLKEDKNSKESLIATIDSSKVDIKVGDTINFVGTIDIKSEEIHLSKISKDTIDYKSVVNVSFKELYDNIRLVKDTYFIVSGYMITEDDTYKLFDNKDEALKEDNLGRYFIVEWNEVLYTGNQNVDLRCKLVDTYKLGDCSLIKK